MGISDLLKSQMLSSLDDYISDLEVGMILCPAWIRRSYWGGIMRCRQRRLYHTSKLAAEVWIMPGNLKLCSMLSQWACFAWFNSLRRRSVAWWLMGSSISFNLKLKMNSDSERETTGSIDLSMLKASRMQCCTVRKYYRFIWCCSWRLQSFHFRTETADVYHFP